MKQLVCLICAVGLIVSVSSAQLPTIRLSTNKTSSLLFPLPIKHVDRGSPSFLVELVGTADHILLLKAAEEGFGETNLSVVTEDGTLYTFTVCFDAHPATLSYAVPYQQKASERTYAQMILDNPPLFRGVSCERWGVSLRLAGVYVRGSALFLQLIIENRSTLDYEVDYLRFAVQDKKGAKRTAVQVREVLPLHLTGNTTKVAGGSRSSLVAVLPLLTLPDRQQLLIELGEKGGGRNLQLRTGNRNLVHATPLPDH